MPSKDLTPWKKAHGFGIGHIWFKFWLNRSSVERARPCRRWQRFCWLPAGISPWPTLGFDSVAHPVLWIRPSPLWYLCSWRWCYICYICYINDVCNYFCGALADYPLVSDVCGLPFKPFPESHPGRSVKTSNWCPIFAPLRTWPNGLWVFANQRPVGLLLDVVSRNCWYLGHGPSHFVRMIMKGYRHTDPLPQIPLCLWQPCWVVLGKWGWCRYMMLETLVGISCGSEAMWRLSAGIAESSNMYNIYIYISTYMDIYIYILCGGFKQIYIYIHPPKNGYYFASPWIFLKCGKELPSRGPQRSSVGIMGVPQ